MAINNADAELTPEQAEVASRFAQGLGDFKGKRICIYGIGVTTRLILDQFPTLDVIGLLDPSAVGQHVYGRPVLALDDALALAPDRIIIVARANNTRIIRSRIAEDCRASGVALYDLDGNDLLAEDAGADNADDDYCDLTQNVAMDLIEAADSVSFDIFDTLLMRRTLYPRDVFELVAERSRDWGLEDFAIIRGQAESELSVSKSPTLSEIYCRLQELSSCDPVTAGRLMSLELEVEDEVLVPRTAVVELLNHAVELGRPVTLISDMYLTPDFISQLLRRRSISGWSALLVSSDIGVFKEHGLFDHCERIPGGTHLHIGDNQLADGQSAVRAGMQSLVIRSAHEMLERSPLRSALKVATDLPSRLRIGMVIAHGFNDPFITARNHSRLLVETPHDFGKLVLAPLMIAFLEWLCDEVESLDIDLLVCAARDGYLVEQLITRYAQARREHGVQDRALPAARYLLTSRLATALPMVRDATSLVEVGRYPFSGSPEALLEERFLLDPDDISPHAEGEGLEAYLLRHLVAISEGAERARANYLTYLDCSGIMDPQNVGLVDFVAAGTTQVGFESLIGRPATGFYFQRLASDDPRKAALRVHAMAGTSTAFGEAGALSSSYLFLENFLSSPHPSLRGFDDEGRPEYCPESRSADEIEFVNQVHEAVLDSFDTWLSLRSARLDRAGDVAARFQWGLLGLQHCEIEPSIYSGRLTTDEFTHRSFSWAESLG